jgi:threonine/homoserine/homoserine lactone efflux protein
MPISSQLIVFCFTAVVLILTPGPNFVYILTRGTTQGRRAALFAVLGLGCGVMIHTMLASIGISALIRSSYLLFQIIKYGGSLYLIYLGLQTLRNQTICTLLLVLFQREINESFGKVSSRA